MYGVKTIVPTSGCSLAGFIDCQLKTLMPSLQDVKVAIADLDNDNTNVINVETHKEKIDTYIFSLNF